MGINVNQPSANKETSAHPQTTELTATPQSTCTNLPKEYSYLDVTYYTVTPIKFILFNFLTGGLYVFFWAFKNWRVASNNGKGKGIVMPILLTPIIHLSVLGFVYRIKGTLAARGLTSKLSYLAVFAMSFAAITIKTVDSLEADITALVLQTAVFTVINNGFIKLNTLKHPARVDEKKIVGWEWLNIVIFIVAIVIMYTGV